MCFTLSQHILASGKVLFIVEQLNCTASIAFDLIEAYFFFFVWNMHEENNGVRYGSSMKKRYWVKQEQVWFRESFANCYSNAKFL